MSGGWLGHHASAGRLAAVLRTVWLDVRVHAGLELADGDNLVLAQTQMVMEGSCGAGRHRAAVEAG
jgi:hypothetical protein